MTPYYQDDAVTIYHGDALEIAPGLAFDVIVTDPPYGMDWDPQGGRHHVRAAWGREFPRIHGDDAPFDPAPWLALNRPTVLFGGNHYADSLPPSPAWIVWDKREDMGSNDQSDCELAWSNVGGRARLIRYKFNGGGSFARENGIPSGRGKPVTIHPSQKPVAVMRQIIGWMPDGVILDPFMGSGTTLAAAKEAGRRAIGIEIEERYCEVAANRCRQEVLGLAV